MTRRLISALLLVCFSVTFATPVFAIYAQQSAKLSCCKPGRHACCKMHSRQRTETGWAAAPECNRQCSINSTAPLIGDSALHSVSSQAAEPLSNVLAAFEENRAHSTSYLAFLYQLPPPVPVY
jgi:hypothetical protein